MSHGQEDKEVEGIILAPYRYASPSEELTPTHQETPRTRLSKDGTRIILRRKGKPHVSSACLHCRKSHLACDKNRPCNRCISAGRANDCFDTQHKKRGRPKSNPSASSTTDSSVSSRIDVTANTVLDSGCPSPGHHKRTQVRRLTPILPSFEPKHDHRTILDLLTPKATPSSPDKDSSTLELTLDRNVKCLRKEGPDKFLGIDTGQIVHESLYDWVHPNDCEKLAQALYTLTTRRLTASAAPSSHLRVHLLCEDGHHELVDMSLAPGLEQGSTLCEITKFNLDALLRQAPPGDSSLFQ